MEIQAKTEEELRFSFFSARFCRWSSLDTVDTRWKIVSGTDGNVLGDYFSVYRVLLNM